MCRPIIYRFIFRGIFAIQPWKGFILSGHKNRCYAITGGDMHIYGEYVLRKATRDDADGLYAVCTDPDVMKFYGNPGFDVDDFATVYSEIDWFNDQFNHNAGRWVICKKDDPVYIGDIGFSNYQPHHRRAELGFKLKKDYWGKGVISGFVGRMLSFGFDECGYNRIEALVDERNSGAHRVLEKNSFYLEGVLREYELEKEGFVSLRMYSILRREYL